MNRIGRENHFQKKTLKESILLPLDIIKLLIRFSQKILEKKIFEKN
jgi:hypothetical protein